MLGQAPSSVDSALKDYVLGQVKDKPLKDHLQLCTVELTPDELVLHFSSRRSLYAAAGHTHLMSLLRSLRAVDRHEITYKFNGRTIVQERNGSPLPPPSAITSHRRAVDWVMNCEDAAVLVVEGAALYCSEEYEAVTGMSCLDWAMDWWCIKGALVHGNAVRHLEGGAEALQNAIEAAPNKRLINHEWNAIYAPDGSTRKFRGSFQFVEFEGRKGRILVLDGVPELIPVVTQGTR